MKKDDIEKIFSSLEDFSKIPPDDLWKGIEEKLDKPKKKRRLAFWWPVAASLVIGLGLLATFYFHSNEVNPLINVPAENRNGVVNQSRSADSTEKENTIQKKESENKIQDIQLTNSDSHHESKNEADEKPTQSLKNINSNKNQVVLNNKETIAAIVKKDASVLVNKSENKTQAQIKGNKDLIQENKIAAENKAIAEKPAQVAKAKDNLTPTEEQENALAILAKEQQKKGKIAAVEDKWSLQVFAGVNSSQNLKNQKSLGNTIESQKGYSYGVKTNYKLNRRWAVSTGLKVSELGQQVANVSYVNSAKSLVNISKVPFSAPQGKGTIATNSNYLFIPNTNHSQNSVVSGSNSSFYETGDLSQKVQYLEMPMEVSYSILNKGKARVNMNTGGFIGKVISNEVLLDDNSIGKNSDVNEVIFGTVLSSTLQYELFKKTKVFVEPGMNFYTQPVQNQNFNQFQLIFNFGLNVSF